MKCHECWKQGAKRTNKVVIHSIVGDYNCFVCDECYNNIKTGNYSPVVEIYNAVIEVESNG